MGFYYGQPANIRHYNNGTAEIVLENGTTLPLRWYYGNAPRSNQPRRDGSSGIWYDNGEGYISAAYLFCPGQFYPVLSFEDQFLP